MRRAKAARKTNSLKAQEITSNVRKVSKMATQKYKILWFSDEKGIGLAKDSSGHIVYLHYSQIKAPKGQWRTLKPGQTVSIALDPERAWIASRVWARR